ncbi:hypothetical protein [uncultured Oscillibacter sp.]|uniref:hypothetical protein n=1 Tax=uncultured Oscillibacter sp. TaxID=876091 RepID=UPI0025D60841|nr:hypothetical protein [uncultured Oscillibacter sp.]
MASVALSAKAVGSTVKLKVGGTARNFIVVHKGKPSAAYDASCDGVWLFASGTAPTSTTTPTAPSTHVRL